MMVFVDRGKPENPEKTPWSKAGTIQHQTPPTLWQQAGIEAVRSHKWEASPLTTGPSRHPTPKLP